MLRHALCTHRVVISTRPRPCLAGCCMRRRHESAQRRAGDGVTFHDYHPTRHIRTLGLLYTIVPHPGPASLG